MSFYRSAPDRGFVAAAGLIAACFLGLAIPLWPLWINPELVLSFNDGNIERTLSPLFSYPGSLTRVWNDHFFFGRGESGIGLNGWSLLETLLGPHGYRRYSPLLAAAFVCLTSYWSCRQMARSRSAASIAALFAAFCGWTATASLSGLVGRPLALGWAMLAIGLLERTHRRSYDAPSKLLGYVLAGAAVGLAISEIADVGAFFALSISGWWLLAIRSWPELKERRWRHGLLFAVLVVTSGLVASHTLDKMVSTELAASLAEEKTSEESWDWATQWSLPVNETWSLIVPDFHGASSRSKESPYWGHLGRTPSLDIGGTAGWRNFKLNGYAVGTVAALLVVLLAAEVRRQDGPLPAPERRRALTALGLIGLSLMLAWGRFFVVYRGLYALPYLDGIRNPEKWLGPLSLFCAVAIAYAADIVMARAGADSAENSSWTRRIDVACFLFAVVCVFALGWTPPIEGLSAEGHEAAHQAARSATILSLLALGGLAIGWRIVQRLPLRRRAKGAAAIIAITLSSQLVLAVTPYVETTDYAYLKAPSRLGQALDSLHPTGRLKLLPPRDPLLNNWRLSHLASRAVPLFDPISIRAMPGDEQRLFTALRTRPLDLWRMAGIRWFLCTPEAEAELLAQDPGFVVRERLLPGQWDPRFSDTERSEASQFANLLGRPISLVEWQPAAAPIRLAAAWRQVEDSPQADQALLRSFLDPEFSIGPEPIVHTPKGFEPPLAEDGERSVEVVEDNPTRVELTTRGSGILMRTSRFDSRWRVSLDGEPTTLLRTNFLFQGVAIPPGEHRVTFEFAPAQTLFVGSVLMRLVLLLAAGLWIYKTPAPRAAGVLSAEVRP